MSIVIGGEYKHYKGNKYRVIGIAKHSETLEKMVVYKALYGFGEVWVRPYNMFNDTIVKQGNEIKRFQYLGNKLETEYKVYVTMEKEIRNCIWENQIDFERELIKDVEGINIEHDKNIVDKHEKSTAMIVLASGVAISMVIWSISKIIKAVSERPRTIVIIERDAEGNVIKETPMLLEPQSKPERLEFDFKVGMDNIEIKILNDINILR